MALRTDRGIALPNLRPRHWSVCAPGPAWTSAENLAPTGIRSPDRPARSESLYQLRYPGRHVNINKLYIV